MSFTLPETVGGSEWTRLLDTNLPDSQEAESFAAGGQYDVTGRSMLMFVLKPDADGGRNGEGTQEMVRSYRHVMQAFERANIERVRFATSQEERD